MVAVVLGPVRFQMPPAAFSGGTGDPPLTARRLVRSTHTIAHGSGGTSRLVLPVFRVQGGATPLLAIRPPVRASRPLSTSTP